MRYTYRGVRGREREREGGSVEREKDERRWKGDGATRRGARQTERERDGRHGARTQPITKHGCVESVTRVLTAATQFTKFFLHVVGSYLDSVFPPTPLYILHVCCTYASRKEAEAAPLSLLLAFPVSFSRAFTQSRIRHETLTFFFFFFFYCRGNLGENGGGRREGLGNFLSFPRLDLN